MARFAFLFLNVLINPSKSPMCKNVWSVVTEYWAVKTAPIILTPNTELYRNCVLLVVQYLSGWWSPNKHWWREEVRHLRNVRHSSNCYHFEIGIAPIATISKYFSWISNSSDHTVSILVLFLFWIRCEDYSGGVIQKYHLILRQTFFYLSNVFCSEISKWWLMILLQVYGNMTSVHESVITILRPKQNDRQFANDIL